MAKQNIYDNDSFFENFKNLRNNKINFNDCIETPILLAMIPEVDGKRVLDIGCGMGQHAKQYSDMGAESVLGIDISEKMLEYAKEHFHAKNITYRQMHLLRSLLPYIHRLYPESPDSHHLSGRK